MTTASALGATAVFAAAWITVIAVLARWIGPTIRIADIREQVEAEHAGVFYQPRNDARSHIGERLGGGRGVSHSSLIDGAVHNDHQ